ncbi:unnamed protein product [Effrenium voratum]|nr:unnamed protein product [Effrenium voratum]
MVSASADMNTALLALPRCWAVNGPSDVMRLLNSKTADCQNFLTASDENEAWSSSCERRDVPSVGNYLMKQLMHWEGLLEQYDAIEQRCKHSMELYETQVLRYSSLKSRQKHGVHECGPLQAEMDAAACKQAMDRIEACGAFDDCSNATITRRATTLSSICKQESSMKDTWYGISTMECMLKSYRDNTGTEDLRSKLDECKSHTKAHYGVARFVLKGCHAVEAPMAEALRAVKEDSKTWLACAVAPENDPSMSGTDAYEVTYYRGFEAKRCNATCCSNPPYPTTTTITTTSTTTFTTTTTTTTPCTDVNLGCLLNAPKCNNTQLGRILAVRSSPICEDDMLEFRGHEQPDCDYDAENLRILANQRLGR